MEARIKRHKFKLVTELVIAVFDINNNEDEEELPHSFIHLEKGDVKTLKDFHYEIMDWYNKNIEYA